MPTVTPLPTPPSSADPANFNAAADAFLGALPQFATEANAVIDAINAANAAGATAANAAAAESSSSALAASGSAAAAAASASDAAARVVDAQIRVDQAAASAAYRGEWSSLSGPLARPASVSHVGALWLLGSDLPDVSAAEPGVSSSWVAFAPALSPVVIRSDTQAGAWKHYLIAASCVLTLPATPQPGMQVRFTNVSGTMTAVVDPGAAMIRGVAGPMVLDTTSAQATLTYSGAAYGWV